MRPPAPHHRLDLLLHELKVRLTADGGQVGTVVRELTEFGVRSLIGHPPTLEELMLRHYGDELAANGHGAGQDTDGEPR